MTAPPRGDDRDAYDSKFASWDRRASVRTKPRRELDEDEASVLPFPPELVPALRHPLVVHRGPEAARRILVQSLYAYFHFTVVLEQVAVMPVTTRIALGQSGVDLPRPMRGDAYKITTDEAWHAQFSYELVEQATERFAVPSRVPAEPQFVRRLDATRESFEPAMRRLVDLFFATVSETLVSGFLLDLPYDERLPRSVRALVLDHAEDEGRHHAYFRAFLRFAWPQLSDAERRLIGPRVPDLIRLFLEPDVEAAVVALRDAGLPEHEVATVVAESCRSSRVSGSIVTAARATVRSFREVDALDDAATYDAFASSGLVP